MQATVGEKRECRLLPLRAVHDDRCCYSVFQFVCLALVRAVHEGAVVLCACWLFAVRVPLNPHAANERHFVFLWACLLRLCEPVFGLRLFVA